MKLGGRAFDLLLALIEAQGVVVGKRALTGRVWPGRIVEENNLLIQMSVLRRALGLELASGTASPESVAGALRSKQILLVLDNCEHVIDAAARMAEALLRVNPDARVIATSREPLRARGEWV